MCVSWNDNGLVLVISNAYEPIPVTTTKRWSSQIKEYIKIDQPRCITWHDKHVAEVDSLDALVGVHRIDTCGKKWYWLHYISIISWMS